MKNINFLNNGKLKDRNLVNSKSPKSSMFFYFLKKWSFFNNILINNLKKDFIFCLKKPNK